MQSSTVALDELERLTIQRVFEKVGGDKTKAGELLGISRATLYRKLKRYQISANSARREDSSLKPAHECCPYASRNPLPLFPSETKGRNLRFAAKPYLVLWSKLQENELLSEPADSLPPLVVLLHYLLWMLVLRRLRK